MKLTYAIAHWALAILLTPFIAEVIQYIWGTNPHQVVGLLEAYAITLLFSIAYALPTFLVYMTCFHFLSKTNINAARLKFILIAISFLGIYITPTIIEGTMRQDIIIAYAVTAIIVGLLLRIKKSKTKTPDNFITT